MKDLPETRSADFSKALQELGFSSALDRVKIAKAINTLRDKEVGSVANEVNPEAWDTAKFDTWQYDEMSKLQKTEAKNMVKDFVKTMVQGRRLQAIQADSGEIVDAQVCLNKRVDRLTVDVGDKTGPIVTELCDILDVVANVEPHLSVTVKTACLSEVCLLLPNLEERDTFTNALGILSQVAQKPKL